MPRPKIVHLPDRQSNRAKSRTAPFRKRRVRHPKKKVFTWWREDRPPAHPKKIRPHLGGAKVGHPDGVLPFAPRVRVLLKLARFGQVIANRVNVWFWNAALSGLNLLRRFRALLRFYFLRHFRPSKSCLRWRLHATSRAITPRQPAAQSCRCARVYITHQRIQNHFRSAGSHASIEQNEGKSRTLLKAKRAASEKDGSSTRWCEGPTPSRDSVGDGLNKWCRADGLAIRTERA